MSSEPARPDEDPDLADPELVEDGAEAAARRAGRDRATMPAKEFVSERDALEDLWSGEPSGRDEGW